VRTEPLGDGERRLIHHALRADDRVGTRSVGRGPLRPILIAPKGMEGERDERRPRAGRGRGRRSSKGSGRGSGRGAGGRRRSDRKQTSN
jgi:spoIIIJ-associated protein